MMIHYLRLPDIAPGYFKNLKTWDNISMILQIFENHHFFSWSSLQEAFFLAEIFNFKNLHR
jgi:hypothetical protein